MKPKPLIIDNGMLACVAERMARDQEVAYFSSWDNAFPTSRDFIAGSGIPGVERVADAVAFMLDGGASHLVIPDLYLASYARLAKQLEIPVFGSGEGERLEDDRWFMAELLQAAGLPVIPTVEITGLEELAEYLRDKQDKYLKVSLFRGDMETEHWTDWDDMQAWLNSQRLRFGPIGAHIRFMVQDALESDRETGIDTFFQDGWAMPMILGDEIKDKAYAGRLIQEPPQSVVPVLNAVGDYFAKVNYRGFFSNEMRIAKGGEAYMTDATTRMPSPPGGVMLQSCTNFSEVVLNGAAPDYGKAKYFCELALTIDGGCSDFLRLRVPDKLKDRYSFRSYFREGDDIWYVPMSDHATIAGYALGWAESLNDAAEMAKEAAKAVKAKNVVFEEAKLEEAVKQLTENYGTGD